MRGSPTPPGKCVFPADCTRRTRTLPRVRSAVVLPTVGDPRRIRSLQPVQPYTLPQVQSAVVLPTAGYSHRVRSLLPVQPTVLLPAAGAAHHKVRTTASGLTSGTAIKSSVLKFQGILTCTSTALTCQNSTCQNSTCQNSTCQKFRVYCSTTY